MSNLKATQQTQEIKRSDLDTDWSDLNTHVIENFEYLKANSKVYGVDELTCRPRTKAERRVTPSRAWTKRGESSRQVLRVC
jgi:hypothetical protein